MNNRAKDTNAYRDSEILAHGLVNEHYTFVVNGASQELRSTQTSREERSKNTKTPTGTLEKLPA